MNYPKKVTYMVMFVRYWSRTPYTMYGAKGMSGVR